MRISDWSSDVCSSDLLLGSTAEMNFHLLAADPGPGGGPGGRVSPGVRLLPATDGAARYPVQARIAVSGERLVDAQAAFDQRTGQPVVSFRLGRKSVGEGQSVSVRVGLGGCRLLKKKN